MRRKTCAAPDPIRLTTLFLLARGGCRAAADEVFGLLGPWLLDRALASLRHRADTEDVTQTVLTRIWATIASFDPARGSVLTWWRRILTNEIISHYRRPTRSRSLQIDPPSTRDDPLLVAEDDDDRAQLNQAIDRLEPDQGIAIRLRDFDELDFRHLADSTHVSLGTASGRVYRGLANIRRSLPSPRAA